MVARDVARKELQRAGLVMVSGRKYFLCCCDGEKRYRGVTRTCCKVHGGQRRGDE